MAGAENEDGPNPGTFPTVDSRRRFDGCHSFRFSLNGDTGPGADASRGIFLTIIR